MAEIIKGVQVVWGIAGAAKTDQDTITTAGIGQSFTLTKGSALEEIPDEVGDIVAAVFHGAYTEGSCEVVCVSTTTIPEVGDELTITADGVTGGLGLCTGATITYNGAQTKKLSVTFKHFPEMSGTP